MYLGEEWAVVIATKDFNDSHLSSLCVCICELTMKVKVQCNLAERKRNTIYDTIKSHGTGLLTEA